MTSYSRPLALRLFDLTNGGRASPHFLPFAKALSECPGPILGLDIGLRHIGVSLSDSQRLVSFSQRGFQRAGIRQDITTIRDVIKHAPVHAAIVGMPSAQAAPVADKLQQFVSTYVQGILPECGIGLVGFWDESYSTRIAKEAFMTGTRKRLRNRLSYRKRSVDAAAAAIILQDALDALREVP
eukprot:GFKZ01006809.1.p1 GENE.GFKZ01006809.1~~GFKZ01006809.1.p1  ORF type:complete len:183 (-),score=9.42 GFKZ01006809.1:337-885(-)